MLTFALELRLGDAVWEDADSGWCLSIDKERRKSLYGASNKSKFEDASPIFVFNGIVGVIHSAGQRSAKIVAYLRCDILPC